MLEAVRADCLVRGECERLRLAGGDGLELAVDGGDAGVDAAAGGSTRREATNCDSPHIDHHGCSGPSSPL